MSKTKDKSSDRPRRDGSPRPSEADSAEPSAWGLAVRETVESIVIAFVLAFLFRTFEAEAFVIPTGSMAATLMGRHFDVTCPECDYRFQVGAQTEENEALNEKNHMLPPAIECVCPMCRNRFALTDSGPDHRPKEPIYNGDRILVNKFSFDLAAPDRWNVIVFRFPEDAKTNYIKRLIGLPDEIIRIRDGDITVSHDGGKTFDYSHRDLPKLQAMLKVVYDNDYALERFIERGWPARWRDSGGGAWKPAENSAGKIDWKTFVASGKPAAGQAANGGPAGESWLRYYNYIATKEDWQYFEPNRKNKQSKPILWGGPTGERLPTPQPITDFIAYDIGSGRMGRDYRETVDDLAVDFQADVQAAEGRIVLELVKHGQPFQCVLDLAAGTAEMRVPWAKPGEQPRAKEGCISRTGSYRLFFANVDHELTLAINDRTVKFDKPTTYEFPDDRTAASDSPVGIGSSGAGVQVSHLRVLRDIYYTYEVRRDDPNDQRGYTPLPKYDERTAPNGWPKNIDWVCFPTEAAEKLSQSKADVHRDDQFYFVGPGQYFALGDNSPLSADGRLWRNMHFVDRRLLIGKALFIYWPHSFDSPVPYFPNFSRMRFVR